MNVKACSKCGKVKYMNSFYICKKKLKDGTIRVSRRAECKMCRKKTQKAWKERRKEHVRSYAKDWRHANEEKWKKYRRESYLKNKEGRYQRYKHCATKHEKKRTRSLSDGYVRKMLARELGVPARDVWPELIPLRRTIILARRMIKRFAA